MTRRLDSFNIIQNNVLGAHALWQFCRYYHEYHPEKNYPLVLHTLPVLPIVFNERARDRIKNRAFKEGSLLIVINETRDVYSGLQDRMEEMADLTFASISNGVAFKLLDYDRKTSMLIPRAATFPENEMTKEYRDILSSSRRIGAWFGQLTFIEIKTYFNIVF